MSVETTHILFAQHAAHRSSLCLDVSTLFRFVPKLPRVARRCFHQLLQLPRAAHVCSSDPRLQLS
jgi:hypothetical protein